VDAQISRYMAYVQKERGAKDTLPLAFVYGFEDPKHLERPHAQEERLVLAAARKRAEALGYHLELFWLRDPTIPPARLRRILLAQGCPGIIFWACVMAELPMDITGFAAVCLGPGIKSPEMHTVMSDAWSQSELIFQQVKSRGYQRFGVALFTYEPDRVFPMESRLYQAAATGDIAAGIPFFKTSSFRPGPFLQWVAQYKPEVIWIYHPVMAEWLREAGYKVPGDISVVYHVSPEIDKVGSGVDRAVADHAQTAIDTLVGQLHRNESGVPRIPHKITITGRWVEGHTLPNVRKRIAPIV
jgi:LacI family transcriptional regulator